MNAANEVNTPIVTIRGKFSYHQRIAIPADALAEFTLSDISLMDIEAPLLTKQHYVLNGRQVPLPFELEVEATKIASKEKRYGIAARITAADGRLLWVTDTNFTLPSEHGTAIDIGNLPLIQAQ